MKGLKWSMEREDQAQRTLEEGLYDSPAADHGNPLSSGKTGYTCSL